MTYRISQRLNVRTSTWNMHVELTERSLLSAGSRFQSDLTNWEPPLCSDSGFLTVSLWQVRAETPWKAVGQFWMGAWRPTFASFILLARCSLISRLVGMSCRAPVKGRLLDWSYGQDEPLIFPVITFFNLLQDFLSRTLTLLSNMSQ